MEASGELTIENFVNGNFVKSDELIDSFDPSTGRVWAKIPNSTETEVCQAVNAAKSAFKGWSGKPPQERSQILLQIANVLESKLDEFARFESRDQGKPVSLATMVDIPRAVYNLRFFATAILHHLNISHPLEKMDAFSYTTSEPVGVAGLISPWNLPIYLLTFKIAPCIAVGNTCVCKPSEMTSVTAWMLCKVFQQAGLPPGVVNMVFGTGLRTGNALIKHPDVPLISFTGSTATAETIQVAAAPFCKKLSLELGGKNPAVIFNDADFDKCIQFTIRSSFANQGEICLCTSRIFVQRGIYDQFVSKFVEATRNIKVGDPRVEDTRCGALVSKEHLAKVKGYVEIARKEGATVACGDEDLDLPQECKNGYFMRPTVITDVTDESRLMQEEIFGPVTCIVPFDTELEVIERANNVKYGLCATVWTRDTSCAHRVSHKLQAGSVWVNCWLVRDLSMPFGGMKSSGIGREGFRESIDFFTEKKTVCIQLN
ncbi:2-aminomuconic semialdehyde dehydrogenase-like [Tubulanus polymorphus]|uniref:2-aminomuconic semialdehyde dehydrogenase-like n=1 Tax=Tubulanus polymorphus TaxID=672921 RepID=UPI003DA541A3